MSHVVLFSGGINSWCAAKRVADKHGTRDMILVFADTQAEDQDLYRFIDEATAKLGAKLVTIKQTGRDIWSVYADHGRIDGELCATALKREPCARFLEKHFDIAETTVYVGFDWTEPHRLEKLRASNPGWKYEAPLTEEPYLSKSDMLDLARAEGLRLPRLYELGFPHANCGGFCPKAGLAHFRHLFEKLPEKYLEAEVNEDALGCAFLRLNPPLTLAQYRERYLERANYIDDFDWGGCGCFA